MHEATISRRAFLKGSAALSFALVLRPGRAGAAVAGKAFAPHAVLRIDADDTVRIIMPHAEMGQGVYTGLAQILADELDADFDRVVATHLDSLDPAFNHPAWGVIATGASTSINAQWQNFREIGAAARAMLVAAAAARWDVAADSLRTERSAVVEDASGRRLRYGELTAAAARLEPPAEVKLKDPSEFTLIGRSVQRLDSATKSDGGAVFGIDVRLPGMLYAAIAHCPVFGGRVRSFDAKRAESMPGVRAVVGIPTGVAVVADGYWQAKQAKDALDIDFDEGEFAAVSQAELWRQYSELADTPGPVFQQHGRVDFEQAVADISGELRFPFLAHAPMEPLNATAQLKDGRLEIWSGTQFQGIDAPKLAAELGIDVADITIHTQWLGGSFGRRAAPFADYLLEAAQVAQASGIERPIKLLWQREDDIQGGLYRPMALHRYRVGVDDEGLPRHWRHTIVGASINEGGPMEAAFVVDGFDLLSIEGLKENNYQVDNVEYALHTPSHPVSVCWLRGEADTHTGPAVESILNRLARRAGADPFDYRRALLKDTEAGRRMRRVLDALEQAADWSTPPPDGVFRGIAVHPSFGSVCGFAVELERRGTELGFHKVTAAFDCGRVINPASVSAQTQGSVAFALSTLIGQQVTIENGRAVESNFHDYTVARLADVPHVDVHLVDSELDYPTGVGEVAVSPFIPAVMEAVAQATGQEVTSFPLALDGYTFPA
ncbi:MAG: molybdopterin cofactor-binding domain-containing protein [Gammaproteobacteria bacterium]